MHVRRWTEEDLGAIVEMEKRCFADPWSKEVLADCLRYPYYRCFVVEEGGQVCGYCCLTVLFEESEVLNIAVDLPHRGKGLGRLLMDTMHAEAKKLGAERCFLEVRRSNAPALSLYGGLGYRQYGERARYYEDGEDALLMKKEL